ncbi:NLR family CARD domain-containing protein 3 isoform X1 [Astyanax mexicanus]|uniref:NLR family CARD domain-containing protein 3 isoform X1 n=1 Tax=Astyanax mexicanus TaxID=7994 RepID=UPI0020CB3AA1|nr:NLR family CARD domain-containing protein 3 isoform X1 [Astyanax mexicanus]
MEQGPQKSLDDVLHRVLQRHKNNMKDKYENLLKGLHHPDKTLLNKMYPNLYISEEKQSEELKEEHEVLQMEKMPRKHLQNTSINCADIFKCTQGPVEETERKDDEGIKVQKLRSVLTKGISGIGKTVSVQKFALDWAEGKANQDVDFMLVLPFRELNLIKGDPYSLHGLLCAFHPELQDLDPNIYDEHKVVFILDGLDESRIQLNFSNCEKISDINTTSSLDVLMSNLIKGELLPSALIWITSRPSATKQIPPQFIDRMTEMEGFSDPQRDEYFRRESGDEDQAQKIISHINTVRSLQIMCQIPDFCWISNTVLQQIVKQSDTEIPKTLTEMYSHFLLSQINMKNERDPKKLLESNRTGLLKLAELAFKQLMKGNLVFYEEDLRESGIDATEASVYSRIFTEIFREECVLYQRKIYCFIHLSFQEFLAAVYVFCCYENKNTEVLEDFKPQPSKRPVYGCFNPKFREWSKKVSLDELLMGAVDKVLKNQNGHLDLFLRFLLGISLESNQRLLQVLLTLEHSRSEKTAEYIRTIIKELDDDQQCPFSTERSINLFLCLSEMNDQSISRELLEYIKSEKHSNEKLSPVQCSALAYMLLSSEEVLDELDLKKYKASSEDGYSRLLLAVGVCRKALIRSCFSTLYPTTCEILSSALQSLNCPLKELDLSNICIEDSAVETLFSGLKSLHCKLETLRLSGCMVTEEGCSSLASALKSNPSHLKELDLTYNHPAESGVKLLSDILEDPNCALQNLQVKPGGKMWMKPGLKKYACELTLDPNTAYVDLYLSEENRKVERDYQKYQTRADHPDRFDVQKQVLCVESLSGRCYWEAEWDGRGAAIVMSYKGIKRKGYGLDCLFGAWNQSWSIEGNINNSYTFWHNCHLTSISAPVPLSRRVAVYLDWVAGTLSFYNISPNSPTPIHVYTVHHTFTEPLYAGFRLRSRSSVCLCNTE